MLSDANGACAGVLWHAGHELPRVSATLAALRKAGKRLFFVTNNSTKSRAQYRQKFEVLGIQADIDEIYCSVRSSGVRRACGGRAKRCARTGWAAVCGTQGYCAAQYLKLRHPDVRKALTIGAKGLADELASVGVTAKHCPASDSERACPWPTTSPCGRAARGLARAHALYCSYHNPALRRVRLRSNGSRVHGDVGGRGCWRGGGRVGPGLQLPQAVLRVAVLAAPARLRFHRDQLGPMRPFDRPHHPRQRLRCGRHRDERRYVATLAKPAVLPLSCERLAWCTWRLLCRPGRKAVVAGKPSKFLVELLVAQHGLDPARTCMFGDRLSTDIEFGNEASFGTVLVLSGTTSVEQAQSLQAGSRQCPTHVLAHFGLLFDAAAAE